LYVADEGNCTIRKITPDGIVSTYAGNGNRGFANGTALNSSFEFPEVIAADANGNIYVADHANLVIRKISIDGTVSVLAGGGFLGSTNGPSKTATFQGIGGIAIDKQGNLFVTDINKVYKITQAGVVSMIAEGGLLTWLTGIAIDMDGNLFVSNSGSGSHVILKINQQGVVSVFAGMGNPGAADGKGTAASFSIYLGAIVMDREANMYVIDDKRIRMISPTGVVTTIAGGGTGGKTNGDGRLASFYGPYGITIDSSGNLYVTESYGYLVRKIVLTRKN
jgi:sugar lactone lactonase YvrE